MLGIVMIVERKQRKPAFNTTTSSRWSMEEAELLQQTKRISTEKLDNQQGDAEEDGPPTKQNPHYKEQEGKCLNPTTIEAFQEIIWNIFQQMIFKEVSNY
jgi:hypothetical protein